MKVKKGEFIVHSVTDDCIIRVEYKGRIIQMYSFMEEICCFVMTENGNDDKEFFCLYEAMKYIDRTNNQMRQDCCYYLQGAWRLYQELNK